MKENWIYILGVGHNTIVYIELAELCGYKVQGLYHFNDERTGSNVHGIPIIDSHQNLFKKGSLKGLKFAVSVGDNSTRMSLSRTIREREGEIPTLKHPSAVVSKYAVLSESVVIHANSVVQADVFIKQDAVISYNAYVAHTSSIGHGSYLAAGANVGSYVNIHENVLIGQAATIVSGKVGKIGPNSIIGAGSVVINNVEPDTVVAGNPAKHIKFLRLEIK